MSSLWAKISGALVMVIGLLGAALLFVGGQRDRAKEAASRAKAEVKSKSAVLEAERSIERARTQVRTQAVDKQREDDKRPDNNRPSGSFRR